MALASYWRRAVIAGAGLLALGACETVTAPGAPQQPTADIVDRSPRVASEIARGRQALAAGNLQVAQAAFTGALRGSPDDPEPAIGLAETYLAMGDLETAGRLFEIVASTEGGAGDPRLFQGRGLVALGQGRTEEAVGLLEQSVDRDPTQWRAWAGLGRAYGRQGKSRQARSAFDRAEEAAPSPAIVMNDVGMLHLEENDPAAALEAFQRALAVDPGNATASANARIARAMLGDYDAAISGARPDELPNVLNNVGYIAVVNGDFDVADRLLRRAIEVSPVYHEAASANLDLLAQAMKGVPVLALASPGAAATRSTAGAGLQVAGEREQGAAGGLASPARLDGQATYAGPSVGSGEPAEPDSAESLAGDAVAPGPELASASPRASAVEPTGGVMAHGFRWESQPVSAAKPVRKRGKRKAAQSSAPPDAGDPRSSAWPAISVPSAGPTAEATEAEPGQSAQSAQQSAADDRGPSTGVQIAAPQATSAAGQADRPE